MSSAPVALLPGIIPEFFISGIPASGAKLFCYAAGTTTKQTTYTDATGATPQTNPIRLNARGEPQNNSGSSVGLWPQAGVPYKYVLAPPTDTDPPTNPIWTIDNITASSASSGVLTFATFAAAQLANVPAGTTMIALLGYHAVGDAPVAYYIPAVDGTGFGKLQTADGQWFWLDPKQGRIFWEMLGCIGDWTGSSGTDNSTYAQNAVGYAEAYRVTLYIGPGSFSTNSLTTTGNLNLIGQGMDATTIVQRESTSLAGKGTLYAESGSAGAQFSNITVKNLTLDGRVATVGFQEFTHLVSLNGVKDVTFEQVKFLGFRGDGFYLGSGVSAPGLERHNTNVKLLNCVLDGVNNNNRNGISPLDYDGLTIQNCTFANISKSTMPGAIDVEPDAGSTFAVLKNLLIEGNSFKNITGNVGTINVTIAAGVPLPSGIVISNNSETNTFRTFLFSNTFRIPSASDIDIGLVVTSNNVMSSAGAPFLIDGVKGASFENNTWQDLGSSALIGANYKCSNVTIRDQFIRVGSGINPYGLLLNTADTLTITSRFEDCGGYGASAPVAGSAGIRFAAGTTANIRINGSEFAAPQGFMLYSVLASGNTYTPATNQFYGNAVGAGLTNQFQALFSDSIFTAFTPTLIGAASAGVGTYSVQEGLFQINGAKVTYWSKMIWSAHTGTGQTYAPTPTNVTNTVSDMALSVIGDGLFGVANPLGGVIQGNRAQVYQLAGGSLVPQAIVASGEIEISGSYPWAA